MTTPMDQTSAEQLKRLQSLHGDLAGLEVVKCRMIHERVLLDPDSQPRSDDLKRVGLCSRAQRSRNIACGHTMARYVLEKAVNALPEIHRKPLAAELQDVTNEIHALDHHKGEAEKQLAVLTSLPASESARRSAVTIVQAAERQHDACAERIGRLQTAVLARLAELIAAASAPVLEASTTSGADAGA